MTIGVKINMPQTAEGIEQLRKAVEQMNTTIVLNVLNQTTAPMEEKRAYLAGLNGRTPWGGK